MNTKHAISAQNLVHLINKEGKKLSGAPFTIRSKKTGKDYTFKVSQALFNNNNYLHLKVETQYLIFKYMGWYKDGKVINKKVEVDTPASQAISWFMKMLLANKLDVLDSNVDIFHLGKCLKCGKTLTDANSIEVGFGPVCRNF